jgi:hypothetical protein
MRGQAQTIRIAAASISDHPPCKSSWFALRIKMNHD